MRRPILPITALVVAGILISRYAHAAFAFAAIVACCGAILYPWGRMRRRRRLEYAGLVLLLAATGMFLQIRGRTPSLEGLPATWRGEVTGVVEEWPEVRRVKRVVEHDAETEEEETRLTIDMVDEEGRKTGWLANAYVPERVGQATEIC